jgi:hypothetical protein
MDPISQDLYQSTAGVRKQGSRDRTRLWYFAQADIHPWWDASLHRSQSTRRMLQDNQAAVQHSLLLPTWRPETGFDACNTKCSMHEGSSRDQLSPISGPIFRVPRRGQTVPVVSHRWLWIVPQRRRDSLVFVSRSAGRWRAGRAARPSCTGWCIHISIWRRSTIVCHLPGHIARSGSVTGWGFTVARVQRRRIVGRAAVVARGRRSRSHAIIFVFA